MKKQDELIFGIRTVIEAIRSGKEIDRVMVLRKPDSQVIHELLPLMRMAEIPVQYVPMEKLNAITRKNHQGVVAYLSGISYSPVEEIIASAFESGTDPLILILDQVSDVRNFGAIARSAECFGFSGIVIPQKGAARINADAIKTSAGALMHIPVSRVKNLEQTVDYLLASGLQVVSLDEKAGESVSGANFEGPLALVLGSEEFGISPNILKKSNRILRIPMAGMTGSLNVSAAASIMMYEVSRQRISQD